MSPSPQHYRCLPGGGNTPCGLSPYPQGARLALRFVHQGDGIHYPVGQPLLGDSLPFLLTSIAEKELLRVSKAPGVVQVYAQCSYRTMQHQGWLCLLRGQCLQVHHLIAEGRGENLGHISRLGFQDNMRVGRPEAKALFSTPSSEGCHDEPEFRKLGQSGPYNATCRACSSSSLTFTQYLREKARWRKCILAQSPRPAVCQCVCVKWSLGRGVIWLAVG